MYGVDNAKHECNGTNESSKGREPHRVGEGLRVVHRTEGGVEGRDTEKPHERDSMAKLLPCGPLYGLVGHQERQHRTSGNQ